MEVKQINQLMLAMCRHQVKKLRWKCEQDELELELASSGEFVMHGNGGYESEAVNPLREDFEKHRTEFERHRQGHPTLPSVEKLKNRMPLDEKEEDDGTSSFITSPMVGTIYMSPSPTDKPFVAVGDTVTPTTVVCIVEAMKVMNEVKAGVSGTIKEILVEKGQPVDFGAKLFKIT